MFETQFSLQANQKKLLSAYKSVRSQTLTLCDPLEKEDFVVQPVMDVSPPKWHLAHTTWFFETFVLKPNLKGYKLFHVDYPYLFNSYYISAGGRWSRGSRGHLTRPTVDQVIEYRHYVDEHVELLLSEIEFNEELSYIFEVGLNHEQQHQELMIYDIKYILGFNPLFPAYKEKVKVPHTTDPVQWLSVEEGVYEIGHEGSSYCFDNELGRHKVYINAFAISSQLITNREYLEFIDAGGYENHMYWLSEGWDWIHTLETKAPMYWMIEQGHWSVYELEGLADLDLDAPVTHISFYEADAFANWKGLKLPTEFEWEVACRQFQSEHSTGGNFLERRLFKPLAESKQFFGNLWEWTSSPYRPYPDFQPAGGSLGEYNGKFMINTMVLRGGSYATPQNHIRATYRNFFHPNLQWMSSGMRLVKHH